MKPAPAPYRWLLRLYPEAFRRAYGAEMERMFARMLARERASRGLAGALSVWAGATADAARSGLRERRNQRPGRRTGGVMNGLRTDIRQALRGFLSRPGFTLAAVLTVALGIGANTAIFSIVNASMLRPLPYKDPDRLVLLWQTFDRFGMTEVPWSMHDLIDVREQATQLSHVALFRSGSRVMDGDEPRRLAGAVVSPSLFPLLGVDAAIGRVFSDSEERPADSDRVILSHATWQQLFGGDPSVVGSTISLDRRPHTIVGVMPEGFAFPPPVTYGERMLKWEPEVFFPFAIRNEEREGNHSHFAIGRIADSASRASAEAELRSIAADLAKRYPTLNDGVGARMVSLQGQSVRTFRWSLIIMLTAVACVLLIACTSVANLLIARATARRREFALRAAVGASRSRLVRQLLVESLLLGAAGGGLGLLIAAWIVAVVARANPMDLPDIYAARLDWRVLAFTLVATLSAVVVFGLTPALQASRPDLVSVFRSGSRVAGSRSEMRFKSVLVVAQVAIAVLLLALAGLAARSYQTLWNVDAGFDPQRLLSFHIALPEARYPTQQAQLGFADRFISELASQPGTRAAAAATMLPFVFDQNSTSYVVEGEPPLDPAQAQFVDRQIVTPGYFEAIGAELVWGRSLSESDRGFVSAGVVNEALARKHWPDGVWAGRRLAFEEAPADGKGWIDVVGVVRDIRTAGLSQPAVPTIYIPLAQQPPSSFFVLVRTSLDPSRAIAPARAALARLDPGLPMDDIELMQARKSDSVRKPRFTAALLVGFGLLALVIATIGLYGVISFDASQRTREIGIRIALGARASSVRALITRRGLSLTSIGLVIGIAVAIAASKLTQGVLYGVEGADVTTLGAAAATLLLASGLATWLPARRATRVDPMTALRSE